MRSVQASFRVHSSAMRSHTPTHAAMKQAISPALAHPIVNRALSLACFARSSLISAACGTGQSGGRFPARLRPPYKSCFTRDVLVACIVKR